MKRLPSFKRGDSFGLTVSLTDSLDAPITGAASRLRSQIRTVTGSLVAELDITESGTAGTYFLQAGETESWPIELVRMDVEYTSEGGAVSSTETMEFQVEEDITR